MFDDACFSKGKVFSRIIVKCKVEVKLFPKLSESGTRSNHMIADVFENFEILKPKVLITFTSMPEDRTGL